MNKANSNNSKVRKLKAKFHTLKASEFESFEAFIEDLLQAQKKLASMGFVVDDDTAFGMTVS